LFSAVALMAWQEGHPAPQR